MSSPFFSAEHWGANHAGKNTINIFLFLVISSIVFDNFKFKTFGVLYELLSILFLRNFLKHLADMFYHLYRLFPFPDDKEVWVCNNKTKYKCNSNEKNIYTNLKKMRSFVQLTCLHFYSFIKVLPEMVDSFSYQSLLPRWKHLKIIYN